MSETNIKIKNDRPDGASIRIQAWDGKLPTYDSDAQRGAALKAVAAVDADAPAVEEAKTGESLPENYAKLKKDELIALANERKAAGFPIELEETDTVAVLRVKIEGTYEAPAVDEAPEKPVKAVAVDPQCSFSEAKLLKEETLGVGVEKVLTISSGHFLTIKIDE